MELPCAPDCTPAQKYKFGVEKACAALGGFKEGCKAEEFNLLEMTNCKKGEKDCSKLKYEDALAPMEKDCSKCVLLLKTTSIAAEYDRAESCAEFEAMKADCTEEDFNAHGFINSISCEDKEGKCPPSASLLTYAAWTADMKKVCSPCFPVWEKFTIVSVEGEERYCEALEAMKTGCDAESFAAMGFADTYEDWIESAESAVTCGDPASGYGNGYGFGHA